MYAGPDPARRHPPRRRGPPDPRAAHGRHPRRTHHRHPRRDQRHRDPARHDRPHPPPGRQRTRPAPRLRHRPRRLGPGPAPTWRTSGRRTPGTRARHGNRDGRDSGTARDGTDGTGQAFNVWLRRLYTAPGTGELTALDSRARLFPPGLRRLIQARDDTCRTPYCDAPIRHFDHIIPWHRGGPPPRPTAPDSAKPATTPKNPRLDRPDHAPDPDTPSTSPPPPATPTTPPHRHCREPLTGHHADAGPGHGTEPEPPPPTPTPPKTARRAQPATSLAA